MGSRIGAALFLIVGLVAVGIGLWQGWTTTRFVARAAVATGHVASDPETPGMSSAHPAVEFRTAAGALVTYRQNGMGARPVGTPVPLLYDPADPAGTAVANGFWQLWFPVLGPLLLGSAFIALVLSGVQVELRSGRY